MYVKEPIPIQIKPIVISPSARPDLIEFSTVGVGGRGAVLVHVSPGAEAVEAIRIVTRINENHTCR